MKKLSQPKASKIILLCFSLTLMGGCGGAPGEGLSDFTELNPENFNMKKIEKALKKLANGFGI